MKTRFIGVAALAVMLCGCAGPDAAVTSTESPSEREYPTGSNLPRKKNAPANASIPMGEGVRVHSREDLERVQNMGGPTNPDSPKGR